VVVHLENEVTISSDYIWNF